METDFKFGSGLRGETPEWFPYTEVFLDGIPIEHCVEASVVDGRIVEAVNDPDGVLTNRWGHQFKYVTRYGQVEIRFLDAEHKELYERKIRGTEAKFTLLTVDDAWYPWEALYVDGVKVLEDDYITAAELVKFLGDVIDVRSVSEDEFEEKYTEGFPDKLSDVEKGAGEASS